MEIKFFTRDDLLMGSVDQELRMEGSTFHVTQLQVYSLDPEPVVFEVRHTAWVEHPPERKQRIVAYSSELFTDLDKAREHFAQVHLDPPTSVPEGVEFE